MKNIPFRVFPSIGYKNSKIQILSLYDNLEIEIFLEDIIQRSYSISNIGLEVIDKLVEPGLYIVKCKFNNSVFEQQVEIRDAYRLGSSELKNAFVFDQSDYSFLLMKDRLLLYHEIKEYLLTENHLSPSKILQIDKTNYLFLTELSNNSDGIINLGIYNTETFSFRGELLNDFQSIYISTNQNIVWLYQKSSKSIICFNLISEKGEVFSELLRFDNSKEFTFNKELEQIYIVKKEEVVVVNMNESDNPISFLKTTDNAINANGYVLEIEGGAIKWIDLVDQEEIICQYDTNLNIDEGGFLHIGSQLNEVTRLPDYLDFAQQKKDELISELPIDGTYLNYKVYKSHVVGKHYLFKSAQGIFVLQENLIRSLTSVYFKKENGEWKGHPRIKDSKTFSLVYLEGFFKSVKIEQTYDFSFVKYFKGFLIIKQNDKNHVFQNDFVMSFSNECSFDFIEANSVVYLLVKENEFYTFFDTENFETPIFKNEKVYNLDFIREQKVIWYSGKLKLRKKVKFLKGFDLIRKSQMPFDAKKAKHSSYKDASNYSFDKGFFLSSNKIIVNAKTAEIYNSFIGSMICHSADLIKIISKRKNLLYLSTFNKQTKQYVINEIDIPNNKYKESFFSPDGKFLMLKDGTNEYSWYDIESSEIIKYFSGSFLSFSKEGNFIFEDDKKRAAKIYDPLTFENITPPNYHHYRFISPDGKLYAQIASKQKYLNRLNGEELEVVEVSKLRKDLDITYTFYMAPSPENDAYEKRKVQVEKNREKYFRDNKVILEANQIYDASQISSQVIVKLQKFTEIGIIGTSVTKEIHFPDDLAFYNYAAFSYDNKYFGCVGKPSENGLIQLFLINFDEKKSELSIEDSFISRYPNRASWVCGFSKTGYFATYDSTPDTYVIDLNKQFFEKKVGKLELKEKMVRKSNSIFCTYDDWREIKGKNFLCFSPTGKFLALSEQGYEPLTLGGYGHQESTAVHIALTETGEILDSFIGHGSEILIDRYKKVTFVAFSEDEKRIMSLSGDGVVFIRNLKINMP